MKLPDLTNLPLESKVGQLMFIGIPGPELNIETLALIEEVKPGGICLFARNIKEREQTRRLLEELTSSLFVQPFLALDQEGGLVDRLRRVIEPMPAADSLSISADSAELGRLVAETVRILGFNVDFAPVIDVVDEHRSGFSNGLRSRTFGRSVGEVVDLAGSFLSKLEEGGCLGCLKHFPGLGAAEVDSHEHLPVVNIDSQTLETIDLAPYVQLLKATDVGMVMVAHAAFPEVDLQETDRDGRLLPSSLSNSFVTRLLRERLGFDGVVVTDDMEMGAIVKNYGIAEASIMAINAGEDMLAICAGADAIREGYKSVLAAVHSGEISESRIDASLVRIARLKSRISPPLRFDEARLDEISAEISALKNRLN
jgi:beta-N-acetylhexosaminidase